MDSTDLKKKFAKLIASLVQPYERYKLSPYSGDFFVKPEIPYISSVLSIQPASKDPEELAKDKQLLAKFGAKNKEEFIIWARRNCGIACVKMIIATVGQQDPTIMELINEGLKFNGFILYDEQGKLISLGWFHKSLAQLLAKYGFRTVVKKWQSSYSVARDILANQKVILSVRIPALKSIKDDGSYESKPNGEYVGHLVLATGIKMAGKNILGFYVNDPIGLSTYQANTFIPLKTFERIFTNRTIVAT